MGMLSSYRRLYLTFFDMKNGRMKVRADTVEPTGAGALVAMLTRGKLTRDSRQIEFEIVTDPSLDPALKGAPGKDGASAYQIARAGGYGGTEAQWLASLVGASGKSAYQLARDGGYGGTETQWLASLKGTDGKDGTNGTNGVSPALSIGTVTTLPAGSAATASLTGTQSAPKLNLGVPVGAAGQPGVNAFSAPAARTIAAGTAYQATDRTKPAIVTLNLTSTASLTLTGGQTHTADVLIGPTALSVAPTTGAPTGTAIAKYANSNTGGLTVGLAMSTIAGQSATIALPASWFFAVRVTSGTVTITSAFDQAVG